jgi:putative transposase
MSRPKKKSKAQSGETFRLTYRSRAYPTNLQEYRMENWFLVLHGLYNGAVLERKETYKATGESVTYSDQQDALPALKKFNPSLRLVHSQVLQDCLQRVDKAYQKFFDDIKSKNAGRKLKIGYPRMKKLTKYSSFTFPQVWVNGKDGRVTEALKLRCDPDSRFATLILPGIGPLKIRLHRPVDWKNAKTVTVKCTASGIWYASISVEQPLKPKLSRKGRQTGVDLGLMHLTATSDENYRNHPKFLKSSEAKMKKIQKSLSRKRKGSNNCRKERIKLVKIHEHIANQRKDFLHKLSLWLVLNYAFIAFENLNIPGMVKNHHLAKAILDAGWGNLIRYTSYKSVMLRGNSVVRVNPAYTSQDCSKCGFRVPKTLSERLHVCPNCGAVLDRDHNAANTIELKAFGTNTVGAGTAPIRPKGKKPVEIRASAASPSRGKPMSVKQEAPTESDSVSRR